MTHDIQRTIGDTENFKGSSLQSIGTPTRFCQIFWACAFRVACYMLQLFSYYIYIYILIPNIWNPWIWYYKVFEDVIKLRWDHWGSLKMTIIFLRGREFKCRQSKIICDNRDIHKMIDSLVTMGTYIKAI